jgi:hypothetical protein
LKIASGGPLAGACGAAPGQEQRAGQHARQAIALGVAQRLEPACDQSIDRNRRLPLVDQVLQHVDQAKIAQMLQGAADCLQEPGHRLRHGQPEQREATQHVPAGFIR